MAVASATQVVTLLGFGLALPFLPLYVQALGIHERADVAMWSGVLTGAAAIPMAIMAPVWGALADRYGRKSMLVRSMLGGAALIGAMGFVGDVWQLLVLRLLQGGVTGSQAAASALVAAAVPARQVGFALGMVNMAIQVGNSIGPGIGGVTVGGLGFRGSFVLAGVLMAVGGLVAMVWIDEPPRVPRRAQGRTVQPLDAGSWLARTVRPFTWPRFRTVLLIQMGTQFAFSAVYALIPLYLQDMQRPDWLSPEAAAGTAVTLTAAGAAAVMPWVGRLTDERGPHGILLMSLVGAAMFILPQALVPNVVVFMAARAGLGVALAGLTSSLAVLTKLAAPHGREGAAYGAASAAQAFGWGIGPILGAAFAALVSIPSMYLVGALAVAALVVPAWRVRRS